MHRRTMNSWVAPANLYRFNRMGCGHRPHADFARNGPAGVQSMSVRYIGTLHCSMMFLTSMPDLISASSKERATECKCDPIVCQSCSMLSHCSVSSPLRHMR